MLKYRAVILLYHIAARKAPGSIPIPSHSFKNSIVIAEKKVLGLQGVLAKMCQYAKHMADLPINTIPSSAAISELLSITSASIMFF